MEKTDGDKNVKKEIAKFAVMCSLPTAVIFVLGFSVWPSIYLTIPVFFPFTSYSMNTSNWTPTIFHTDTYGWYFLAGYSVTVAAVAAWITRGNKWLVSLAVYCGVLAVASVIVHVVLQALGYQYYMDVP